MDYRKTAAERIKYYRKLCRLSQEELGDVVDISCKHISTLENGEATMGIDTLMKICQAFGVTPNDILLEPDAEGAGLPAKTGRLTVEELLVRARMQARLLYYSLVEGTLDDNEAED